MANNNSAADTFDWRTGIPRERVVAKITDTLKKHIPHSGEEGLNELKKIAEKFEENIYSTATSQLDYLRIISWKMLATEIANHNSILHDRAYGLGSLGMNIPGSAADNAITANSTSNISTVMPQTMQNQTRVQNSPLFLSSAPNVSSNLQNPIGNDEDQVENQLKLMSLN